MAALNNWETRQLDFVLAYPQGPIETDLYMEIPAGFMVAGGNKRYVLKFGAKSIWSETGREGMVQVPVRWVV
jgi:hypothetical protein